MKARRFFEGTFWIDPVLMWQPCRRPG